MPIPSTARFVSGTTARRTPTAGRRRKWAAASPSRITTKSCPVTASTANASEEMAQAMGVVANGGTFYQTRLVQQVQTFDNQIVTAYQVRAKRTLDMSPETLEQVRTGMVDVVNGGGGTAHQASLENVEVAGKTGTAQWGPKHKERTAAWFAGFLPADQPRYAFAAVYEGEVGSKVHGGSAAAPMIADVFKDVYKGQMIARQSHERAQEQPEIRRAEPVEEQDESD